MRLYALISTLFLLVLLASCGKTDRFNVDDQAVTHDSAPVIAIVPAHADRRETNEYYNKTYGNIPIIGLWAGYQQDRHDAIYEGKVESFTTLMAAGLAERLQETKVFEDAEFVPLDTMPARGEYDLVIEGTLNKVQVRGAVIKYGFSVFSDILWTIGLPKYSRRWVIDVDYRVMDGYTGEPISDTKKVQLGTRHTFFTTYANRANVNDLRKDIDPVYDEFIDWFWKEMPNAGDVYWADLKTDGKRLLASQRLDEEQARRGSPPTITFLAPPNNSTLRTPTTEFQWSITAPGGLKVAELMVNNRPVSLGLDGVSLADPEASPRSVPARAITLPLAMGENSIAVTLTDHRGNTTTSSMELTRLPSALRPEQRYALLLAPGDADSQTAIKAISDVLADPLLGQFKTDDVSTAKIDQSTRTTIEKAVRDFGAKPLSGHLAFVYIRAKGNLSDLTIGDGSITMDEFLGVLEDSLATNELILLVDIDWNSAGEEELANKFQKLSGRWALLVTQAQGGASPDPDALADAFVTTMRGSEGSTRRLTLERLLDGILNELDVSAAGKLSPEVYGRYERSTTMVERE